MSPEPDTPVQRAEVEADIVRTRTQLAGTLEDLVAKTQVKRRAKDASRDALAGLGRRGRNGVSRTRDTATRLARRVRGFARTRKGRQSTAMLAGAVTALLAAVRFGSKAGR